MLQSHVHYAYNIHTYVSTTSEMLPYFNVLRKSKGVQFNRTKNETNMVPAAGCETVVELSLGTPAKVQLSNENVEKRLIKG